MRLQTALGGLLMLAAALAFIGGAEAQSPADTTVTLTVTEPNATIPPGGSMDLMVNVTADCSFAVFGGGTATIDVGVEGELPAGVTVAGGSVTIDGMQCLQSQSTTQTQPTALTFSATTEAIGFVAIEGTIVASGSNTAGGSADGSAPMPAGLFVGYAPGHTITPSGDQTFQVEDGMHAFNLSIEVQANAQTMVMFEGKQVPPGAKLDGLKAVVFDVAGGERSAMLPVTFTAPAGDWEEVEVSFENFSHCMGGSPCDPVMKQNVTWTFVNAGGAPSGDGGGGEEESPGVGFLALVGLVGIAALVARRRA